MCLPRTLVEALMALSGSGLLLYAVFGLVVGTIYDTEEPYRIAFAERPVTFVLRLRKSATPPALPFASNVRVAEYSRSAAEPVSVVPLTVPAPGRFNPINIWSNKG